MENSKDFFEFLVDETLNHLHKNIEELSLKDKITHYQLPHMKGIFNPETGMIQFHYKNSVIDIPSNWGAFNLELYSEVVQIFSSGEDHDHLCEIFSLHLDQKIEHLILGVDDGECYIVFLTDNDSFALERFKQDEKLRLAA